MPDYTSPTVSNRGTYTPSGTTETPQTTTPDTTTTIDNAYKGFIDDGLTNYYSSRVTIYDLRNGTRGREIDADGFPVGTSATSKNNTIAHEKELETAKATIQAVNTSTGSAKLDAINARLLFIKKRVDELVKEAGTTSLTTTFDDKEFQQYLTGWKTVVSLIPGGSLLSSLSGIITGVLSADEKQQLLERKTAFYSTALDGYTKDVKTLNALKESLTPVNKAPAPNPNAIYYWLAGAALLFLLFVYLKKRKRRKR